MRNEAFVLQCSGQNAIKKKTKSWSLEICEDLHLNRRDELSVG